MKLNETPLAIVDLETTGVSPQADRVIEVGVICVDHGTISQRWQRLVQPDTRISQHIERITGINNAMVADAPRFADIADELLTLLAGRVFVAHNARFDYGFLKAEFSRLGLRFAPKQLCTVRLSRKLFPQFRSHSLDAVSARLGIANDARHRALGDAQATWQFLDHVLRSVDADSVAAAATQQIGKAALPKGLDAGVVAALPEAPGIYRFFDADGGLLYIGKSNNIRARVQQHFSGDAMRARTQRLHELVHDVSCETTAGELGALLKENAAIKREAPLLNRALRRTRELISARLQEDASGYLRVRLGNELDSSQPTALFRNRSRARETLLKLSAEQRLCKKLLGLESGKGPCFDFQLKRCKGACIGEEAALLHNLRLQTALQPLALRAWPHAGPIAIVEQNADREDWHVIHRWCYLGTARCETDARELAGLRGSFDLDTYRILLRGLRRARGNIVLLGCAAEQTAAAAD